MQLYRIHLRQCTKRYFGFYGSIETITHFGVDVVSRFSGIGQLELSTWLNAVGIGFRCISMERWHVMQGEILFVCLENTNTHERCFEKHVPDEEMSPTNKHSHLSKAKLGSTSNCHH